MVYFVQHTTLLFGTAGEYKYNELIVMGSIPTTIGLCAKTTTFLLWSVLALGSPVSTFLHATNTLGPLKYEGKAVVGELDSSDSFILCHETG